jgi:hypothetical protein
LPPPVALSVRPSPLLSGGADSSADGTTARHGRRGLYEWHSGARPGGRAGIEPPPSLRRHSHLTVRPSLSGLPPAACPVMRPASSPPCDTALAELWTVGSPPADSWPHPQARPLVAAAQLDRDGGSMVAAAVRLFWKMVCRVLFRHSTKVPRVPDG